MYNMRYMFTKGVEDINRAIRVEQSSMQNQRMRATHVQGTLMHSNVLEERLIRHKAQITKEEFIRGFKSTSSVYTTTRHHSYKHKMKSRYLGTFKLISNHYADYGL